MSKNAKKPTPARTLLISGHAEEQLTDAEAYLNDYSRGEEGSRLVERILETFEGVAENLHLGEQPFKQSKLIHRLRLRFNDLSYFLCYYVEHREGTLYHIAGADETQLTLEEHLALIKSGRTNATDWFSGEGR